MATIRLLYHNLGATCEGVLAVRVSESYANACAQARIECHESSLSLGDSITIDLGFTTDYGKVFTGYVRRIEKNLPNATTIITCEDVMSKAVDYFMASDSPEAPYKKFNIKTEDLVEDLLDQADITNYSHDVPLDVTWGITNAGVEFNLVTVWQAIQQITGALAWHCYADRDGEVHLNDRHPYVEGGDTPDYTFSRVAGDLLAVSYEASADQLRNRVVVYGLNNLSATASASSSYLPGGFYKTAVIATPIIDSQSLAQQTANLNLARFNRLTESAEIQIEGNWEVTARQICTITESYTGLTGDWFIHSVEHSFGPAGYVSNLLVTR